MFVNMLIFILNFLDNKRKSAFYFDGKPRYLKTFSFENRKKTESVIGIPPEYVSEYLNNVPEFPDEFRTNFNKSANIIRNSSYYEEMIDENESERNERLARKEQLLSRYQKPPPLALTQKKSLPSNPKSPSFFFLNSNHYSNDEY